MARHPGQLGVARSLGALAMAALAAGIATALFEWDLGRRLSLPAGLAAIAPPVLYLVFAHAVMPRVPLIHKLSWAIAACGVNAGIGLITSLTLVLSSPLPLDRALARAFGGFVPAALVHLVVAPLALLVWVGRALPESVTSSAARPGSPRPRAPDRDGVPRPAPLTRNPNAGSGVFERARPKQGEPVSDPAPTASPSPAVTASPAAVAAPPASQVSASHTPAFVPAGRSSHVPAFVPATAAAQAPATGAAAAHARAFVPAAPAGPAPSVPPAPAAAPPPSLPETSAPAFVASRPATAAPAPAPTTARKSAAPSSRPAEPPPADEAVVRIAFDRIAAQLPADLFTVPPARLGESLREPYTLVVPRHLIVPQLQDGAVEIGWTLIEDQFPDLALAVPASEVRRRYPDWVISLPLDEVVRQLPPDLFHLAAPAADVSAIEDFPEPFTPGPPAPVSDSESPIEPEPPVVASGALASIEPAVAAAPTTLVSEPAPVVAAPAPPVPAAPPPRVKPASPPPAVRRAPAPTMRGPAEKPSAPVVAAAGAPARGGAADAELEELARALATALAALGALDCHARRLAARPVVCFAAPDVSAAAIDALAVRGHALLERLGAWAVDQATVRTARVACVLAPVGSGGTLAVGVRRGGRVALAEVLAGRARGAARFVPGAGAPALVSPLLAPASEGNGRVGEAALALGVFGSLVSAVTAAEGGAPGVYLFARSADAALAGAARVVHETLMAGHDDAALGRLDSVTLRRGRERAIVRSLQNAPGPPALLAAAGDVTLTGRAHRAAARAATLLEAR